MSLRMSGAVPLLLPYAAFMAWTGTTLSFILINVSDKDSFV
jgi:hypothetical protein